MADTETIHAPAAHVTTILSAPRLPTGTGPTIPAPPPIRGRLLDEDCGECLNTGRYVVGVYGGHVEYAYGCPECGREGGE
jgi:hypothetical protein